MALEDPKDRRLLETRDLSFLNTKKKWRHRRGTKGDVRPFMPEEVEALKAVERRYFPDQEDAWLLGFIPHG
jgi:hypothetical protein